MRNPYPKDVFKWDNPEKLDFNRGRFNQHCFEVWENCKQDVFKLIDEIQNDASNERKTSKDKRYWLGCCQILNELKVKIEGKDTIIEESEPR